MGIPQLFYKTLTRLSGSIRLRREVSIYRLLKTAVVGLALAFSVSGAHAQCSGSPLSGLVCGNPNATTGLPTWATQTALIDRGFTASQGQILNRGASVWTSTATPSLGKNGGTGGAITLNGATSGSATIGAKAAAGTVTFNLPVTNGSLNNVLITDGSGNTSWTAAGGGTVSSVGLSMPGIFTVTNSPVTSTGTLTATLNNESANTVWSGPTTGAAAAPTFRALVGADLPNPSASSLGGIQSTVGASHQWVSTISTLGVPGLTQPAFVDISGTLSPTQCPNPSASTIGCVESYASVSHQWINTISTSGVPSSTQPAFTDISGQASLAQLPGIGSNTILSNITGGTATPLANSLSAIIDSSIGSVQGDILYRNGSVWTVLPPGTNGQVLSTGGAAANPSWTTVTGTGTVTSVATNNGVTGGTITSSGTIGLATITTGNVLANTTGSTAVPTPTGPSSVLDVIGSTEGSVLYRGASVWGALGPGTNGQFLQTAGAGSTPNWTNAVTSVVCDGVTISTTGTCPPHYGFANCTVAASVSGNNLTVALKDNAGADPTTGSPCTAWFRSSTSATGSWVSRTVTSATSFVANAGSTFGIANSTAQCDAGSSCPFRLWITLIDTGSTAVLGVVALTNASGVRPFNSATVVTTTACNACVNATAIGTMYSTALQTSKAWTPLGYLDWGSGLATAGTYASGPTTIATFGAGISLPGTVIQSLQATTTSATNTASTAYSTALTQAITPTSSPNILRVTAAQASVASGTTLNSGSIGLFNSTSSTVISQGRVQLSTGVSIFPGNLEGYDSPGSTSAQSIILRVRSDGTNTTGACGVSNTGDNCNLIVSEIQG